MKDCGISGIAVINKERKLITSLSATDFLYLEPENFDYLSLGIKSFLYKVRGFIQASFNEFSFLNFLATNMLFN